MEKKILFLALSTAAALMLSCKKQETALGGMMSLEVETATLVPTRATPVSNLADFQSNVNYFKVSVYDGTTNSLISAAPTYASLQSSSYKVNKNYYWNPARVLDIFTLAPSSSTGDCPTGLTSYSPAPASNTVTFSHSIASCAPSAMPDIMLGRYRGTSSTGAATVKFFHALSALTFYTGDLIDMNIKSIKLEKIYGEGSCTATFGTSSPFAPSFTWTGQKTETDYTYDFSSSPISFTYLDSEKSIAVGGNTFIVIPQTTGSNAKLKLGISIKNGTEEATVYTSISDFKWDPGKLYKYKVDYNKEGMISIATVEVMEWDTSTAAQSLDLTK